MAEVEAPLSAVVEAPLAALVEAPWSEAVEAPDQAVEAPVTAPVAVDAQ